MCDRVVSGDPFMLIYCPDRCKTQKMCDEAVFEDPFSNKPIRNKFQCCQIYIYIYIYIPKCVMKLLMIV